MAFVRPQKCKHKVLGCRLCGKLRAIVSMQNHVPLMPALQPPPFCRRMFNSSVTREESNSKTDAQLFRTFTFIPASPHVYFHPPLKCIAAPVHLPTCIGVIVSTVLISFFYLLLDGTFNGHRLSVCLLLFLCLTHSLIPV